MGIHFLHLYMGMGMDAEVDGMSSHSLDTPCRIIKLIQRVKSTSTHKTCDVQATCVAYAPTSANIWVIGDM